MTDYSNCPGCRALRREADELREHNRQLADILFGLEDAWPKLPGVTPQMERILRVLYKRKSIVTKEALYEVVCLNADSASAPTYKIIDVQVCKLRKCLPKGSFETFWGRGIRLTTIGRNFIKSRLEAHCAPDRKEFSYAAS